MNVPARINLLGGWSDQACWPYPGAVVNAAVGWNDPAWEHSPYPLHYDGERWASCVSGVGTGLGISSIRVAASYLRYAPECARTREDAIEWAVRHERESGVQGGWQDAAGALYPGGKLIATEDHRTFQVTDMTAHPVWQHIVLFDTGIRRESRLIGDSVRRLIEGEPDMEFIRRLRETVVMATLAPTDTAASLIEHAVDMWDFWCEWVPAMHVDVPFVADTVGYMLCGAGGGGFGLYFTHTPEVRARVIKYLRSVGLQAWEPVLLPGIEGEPHG